MSRALRRPFRVRTRTLSILKMCLNWTRIPGHGRRRVWVSNWVFFQWAFSGLFCFKLSIFPQFLKFQIQCSLLKIIEAWSVHIPACWLLYGVSALPRIDVLWTLDRLRQFPVHTYPPNCSRKHLRLSSAVGVIVTVRSRVDAPMHSLLHADDRRRSNAPTHAD